MLAINNIEVVYDRVILVLKGVSIDVGEGSITTLLGANGAGKTTTLKAISGVLNSERGEVTKGTIQFAERRIDGMPAHEVTRLGIVQVFEGRRVFENLTAEENLVAGGHVQKHSASVKQGIELVYSYFPKLKERRHQLSGYLSGGEQQMLSIGRALMSQPRVVLLDEPSLGLAPMLVEEIFGIVGRLVMSWRTAASCWKGRPTNCATIPTSRNSTSASTRAGRANPTATPSTTSDASAGCLSRLQRLTICLTLRKARSARLEGSAAGTVLGSMLRDAALRAAPQHEVVLSWA